MLSIQAEEREEVVRLSTCVIPDCKIQVSRLYLMCPTHWYMVPLPLRTRVWKTWDGGLGIGHPSYLSAKSDAIAAVVASL